jgi:hypothetical protein
VATQTSSFASLLLADSKSKECFIPAQQTAKSVSCLAQILVGQPE